MRRKFLIISNRKNYNFPWWSHIGNLDYLFPPPLVLFEKKFFLLFESIINFNLAVKILLRMLKLNTGHYKFMLKKEKCSICKTLNCLQCEHLTPVRDSLKIKHVKKPTPILKNAQKTIEIVPIESNIIEPTQIEKIPSVLSIKQETQPITQMLVESNESSIEQQPQPESTIHESSSTTSQQLMREESSKSFSKIEIPKIEQTNAHSYKSNRCCVLQ